MEMKDFHTSMEYENDIRTEWLCSNDGTREEHFEPWLFDGHKRVPILMSHLKSLPEESIGSKEGEFMKGLSRFPSLESNLEINKREFGSNKLEVSLFRCSRRTNDLL
jgi:hypothetical protein